MLWTPVTPGLTRALSSGPLPRVWVRRVRSPDGDVAELPLRFALEKEKRAPLEPEKRVHLLV